MRPMALYCGVHITTDSIRINHSVNVRSVLTLNSIASTVRAYNLRDNHLFIYANRVYVCAVCLYLVALRMNTTAMSHVHRAAQPIYCVFSFLALNNSYNEKKQNKSILGGEETRQTLAIYQSDKIQSIYTI